MIEINGNPNRRDLSERHARLASEAGVTIVLNTDAHGVDTLNNMSYAVATARRAWLTAADIANTRSWAEFKKLRKRSLKGRGGRDPLNASRRSSGAVPSPRMAHRPPSPTVGAKHQRDLGPFLSAAGAIWGSRAPKILSEGLRPAQAVEKPPHGPGVGDVGCGRQGPGGARVGHVAERVDPVGVGVEDDRCAGLDGQPGVVVGEVPAVGVAVDLEDRAVRAAASATASTSIP